MAKPEPGPHWDSERKSLRERRSERVGERELEREKESEDHRLSKLTVCMSVGLSNYRLAWCVEPKVYHNTAQVMTPYTAHTCRRKYTYTQQQLLYKAFKQLLHIPIPQNHTYICAHFPSHPVLQKDLKCYRRKLILTHTWTCKHNHTHA